MLIHPFNPHTETTALYDAITRFRQRGEQKRTLDAIFALCDAIDRADAVRTELRQCKLAPQSELALVAINLQILLAVARHELARGQEETVEEIGH